MRPAKSQTQANAKAEAPPAMAGLLLDRLHDTGKAPLIMGIVNVTPDSFSDGGRYFDAGRAIAHGLQLIEAGADILDIGGESTRPGASPVSIDEEIARIVPVIRGLRDTGVPVSVDTRNAATMRAAAETGAAMINDVSALTHDADAMEAVHRSGLPLVLMHAQGTPETMQRAPRYGDVVGEVSLWLKSRVQACLAKGIERRCLVLDPGIGFGKTVEHNVALLQALPDLRALGFPLLVGLSRKSLIGALAPGAVSPEERMPGSLAGALFAAEKGAQILRVHDVAETRQALAVWRGLGGHLERTPFRDRP